MKKKTALYSVILTFATYGCSSVPPSAYFDRAQPESLLETTDEVINIDIGSRSGISNLASAVKSSHPSSAVVTCSNPMLCDEAVRVLESNNVPYERQRGSINSVSLSSTNVQARDCESRYITNHNNPYNLNHPTFGCSIAVNQVQMVSDKRQYTDPLLLGPYDGQKAAQNYDSYLSRDEVVLTTESSTSSSGSSE